MKNEKVLICMFSENEKLTQGRMGNASVEGRISQFLSDQINLGSNNNSITLYIYNFGAVTCTELGSLVY